MNFGIWGVVSLVVYMTALLGVAEVARRAKRDTSMSLSAFVRLSDAVDE